MHFFGVVGSVMFFIGLVAVCVVGGIKLSHILANTPSPLVTNSPYFFLALTMMILGTQLFLTGFVAELVSRNSPNRNKYQLEELLNLEDHGLGFSKLEDN